MVVCPYCNNEAELVGGDVIYPSRPDLHATRFYLCAPCGAYVGCHAGTIRPLGRLANAELRRAKIAAHAAFDPLWKPQNGYRRMTRSAAYRWLTAQLKINREECHIGMFDVNTCRKVVQVCKAK